MSSSRVFRVTKTGAPSSLGPLESRVMEAIWSLDGWVSVNDVCPQLRYKRGEKPLAYTTIKSVMQNLADKHHLKKKAAGKANVFHAVKKREEFERSIIAGVVGPLLRMQRNPLLAHLADELAADDETLAEFERLIAEKRKQRHER